MRKPLVSVLMTVHNRELFIKEAIKSVINSTYENWELIIVDDCSTDNSYSIADSLSTNDERIKLFKNEKNLGDYPNRNCAAGYASGKYLKYLDADDLIYPHTLEIMVESMEKFSDAGLGVSQLLPEDYNPYPYVLTPEETYKREFFGRGVLGFGPTASIIRTSVFKELNGFSEERHTGDSDMWYRITTKYPLLKIQSGLVFWRRHEGQEIAVELKNPIIIAIRYNYLVKLLNDSTIPLSYSDRKKVIKKAKFRHSRKIISILLKNKNPKAAFIIFRNSKISLIWLFKSIFPMN